MRESLRSGRRIGVGARIAGIALLSVITVGCSRAKTFDPVPARPASLPQRDVIIFLVGDAGLASIDDPVIQQLRDDVRRASLQSETLVVYLGDNVYEKGLHPPGDPAYDSETGYLEAQAWVVEGSAARAIFLPGNHDWGYSDKRGLRQIQRQAGYIDSLAARGLPVTFQPPAGCPGPVHVPVGEQVLLLLLETDLWIRDDAPLETCANRTTDAAMAELERALQVNAEGEDRHVLVMGHHPLNTHGTHGGYFTLEDRFFPGTRLWEGLVIPLPFVYPLVKGMGVSSQDLSSSRYQDMQDTLAAIFRRFRDDPLISAGGHDHSLQVIDGADFGVKWILVSGAASKLTPVGDNEPLFAVGEQHGEHGYMRLGFFADGRVLLTVVTDGTSECPDDGEPCRGRATIRYWRWLVERPAVGAN